MGALEYLQRELPLLMSWRHDFHAHPEIGFQETRTAAKVAELLTGWGLEVRTGVGGTGVIGTLRGRQPGNNAIGFRADMDALPMTGRADVPYRSTRPDAFHGCGHDGHTSTLLGAAKYLSEHPDFAGTVYFIFQPAEETLRGSPAMIADGLFTHAPVSEVYGLHNNPLMSPGKIGIRAGAILSGCDPLRIEVHGVGAHGAQPHQGIDPIVAACELVGLLQTIVSRSLDALDSGVVTIGIMHGGTAPNVIPDLVVLEGTIRSTGVGLIYNAAVALFGGLAPFAITLLISTTGNKMSPVYYVVISAVVGIIGLLLLRDRRTETVMMSAPVRST